MTIQTETNCDELRWFLHFIVAKKFKVARAINLYTYDVSSWKPFSGHKTRVAKVLSSSQLLSRQNVANKSNKGKTGTDAGIKLSGKQMKTWSSTQIYVYSSTYTAQSNNGDWHSQKQIQQICSGIDTVIKTDLTHIGSHSTWISSWQCYPGVRFYPVLRKDSAWLRRASWRPSCHVG